VNHDIDDAVRAGMITEDDLPEECIAVFGRGHSHRIGAMVKDIIEASRERNTIAMSEEFTESTNLLKDFLFEKVYNLDKSGVEELLKAKHLLKRLFRRYMEDATQSFRLADGPTQDRPQAVCDFIAGMTDRYTQQQYADLFMPRA
jgi:dGTPase